MNNNQKEYKKTLQNIIVHELTHDIEGQVDYAKLSNFVLNKMKTQEGYESAIENLRNVYSTVYDRNSVDFDTLVDQEAVADFLGENLGNQEFVNELIASQNRNIIQNLYNWISNKVQSFKNNITGNAETEYWRKVKYTFEKALNNEYKESNSIKTKYDIIYNKDGTFNRVKIADNIFENNEGKSITKTIKDYLINHIGEYATIIESGQRVYLGDDLPGEYAYSENAKNLPIATKLAKGRAITELKEIINNATNRQYDPNRKEKHNIDAKYGFYRYDTIFSFDYKGKEKVYPAKILIRNDANGKKYLYDILFDTKKIGNNLLSIDSNSQKSSSINDSSNSLPISSITPLNKDVNTTKYSMQESVYKCQ